MIVEFFSDAISVSVWRYRSVIAIGCGGDDAGGLRQLRGGFELAGRVNDLGALLALGLGLPGHRALHVGRQIDVLHFDRRHLDAPRVGVLIENLLQLLVQPLALRQQIVELDLPEHAAQRRLRELRRRVDVVLDLDDRPPRIHHPEVEHRVDLDRHVVARDHVLRRHVEDHRPQADLHHAIDRREHQDHAGPLRLRQQLAEAEDHAALVLRQDLDRADDVDDQDEHDDQRG